MAGRKIDDHAFWGGKGREYPLPDGAKMKKVASHEGEGGISDYPDTNEKIVSDQGKGDSKIKGHKMKDGYRY